MVKGPVRKGDLMISAGDGFAIACLAPTPGSIIGKALVDFDGDEGIIEARFVNASWKAVGVAAARLRLIQTGYLYHYALIMILGLLALLTWVVWIF